MSSGETSIDRYELNYSTNNFMCQLGWGLVFRYLTEHYFGCFSECGFWKRLTFKLVNFESSKLPSIMWVALIQPAAGLDRTKTDPS